MVICKIYYVDPTTAEEMLFEVESCETKEVLNQFLQFCESKRLGYPENITADYYKVAPDRKSQIRVIK